MIYSDPKLSSSPKFFDLVERLKVGPHSVFWHLHHFWYWCSDRYPDGVLKGVSDLAIASAAQWPQEPKAFVDALAAARFIDRIDGALVLHDWQEWQTEVVRGRERRVTRKKLDKNPGFVQDSSTSVQPSSSYGVPSTASKQPTKTKTTTPLQDVVLVFETNGSLKTWDLSTEHLKKWESVFPGVNILLESKKAKAWCDANPTRRKTARGMESFLLRWFDRAQNNMRGVAGVTAAYKAVQAVEENARIEQAQKEQKERVERILGR